MECGTTFAAAEEEVNPDYFSKFLTIMMMLTAMMMTTFQRKTKSEQSDRSKLFVRQIVVDDDDGDDPNRLIRSVVSRTVRNPKLDHFSKFVKSHL